jgi:hypothetical protein
LSCKPVTDSQLALVAIAKTTISPSLIRIEKWNGPVAILKRCAITTFLLHFAGLTFWDGPAVRVLK